MVKHHSRKIWQRSNVAIRVIHNKNTKIKFLINNIYHKNKILEEENFGELANFTQFAKIFLSNKKFISKN